MPRLHCEEAIASVLAKSEDRTPDISGNVTTRDAGDAIAQELAGQTLRQTAKPS